MPELWIPSGTGEFDFTERKSRFIAEARKISGADEARVRVKELRLEHPRSRHVAWAYVLGKDAALKGMSDDGEPRGTAGRPIIDPICGNNLTFTLVTVVRYFGGVKLGTGGLTSAYGKSSREALARMPRIRLVERIRVEVGIEYALYERVHHLILEAGGIITEEQFESGVTIHIDFPVSGLEEFRRNVKDLSRGTAQFEVGKTGVESGS